MGIFAIILAYLGVIKFYGQYLKNNIIMN